MDRKTALQILKTLARFAQTEQDNVRKLADVEPPQFRLRTQDHRVWLLLHQEAIEILRVRDRKEAYR